MLFSPIYAIKCVSYYYLEIKNTDGVEDFNHMVKEDDLFQIFRLGSGPLVIDKVGSGHICRSCDSRFDANFITTTIQ